MKKAFASRESLWRELQKDLKVKKVGAFVVDSNPLAKRPSLNFASNQLPCISFLIFLSIPFLRREGRVKKEG